MEPKDHSNVLKEMLTKGLVYASNTLFVLCLTMQTICQVCIDSINHVILTTYYSLH